MCELEASLFFGHVLSILLLENHTRDDDGFDRSRLRQSNFKSKFMSMLPTQFTGRFSRLCHIIVRLI